MVDIQKTKKVAVIGSGGAGLCASWLLRNKFDVTLIESQDYLGGHAHTLYMTGDDGYSTCPIDTAFRLFHHDKNPTLGKYFHLLGVPTRVNNLVFSIRTYGTKDSKDEVVEEVFAPPLHNFGHFARNLKSPWVAKAALLYFKGLKEHKKRVATGATKEKGIPVQDVLGSYSGSFKPLNRLIYPFSTAAFVGSIYDDIPRYDFDTFIDFFHETKVVDPFKIEFSTVVGGSSAYVALVENILQSDDRVRVIKSCPISQVRKENGADSTHQRVISEKGNFNETFDHVIMAVPPDVVLNIVPELHNTAKKVMNMIELVGTRTILHKDERFAFPTNNYLVVRAFEDRRTNFATSRPLFVQGRTDFILSSSAKQDQIKPEDFENVHHVFDRYGYALTPSTIHARNLLPSIQGQDNVWFCGAWGAGHYSHEGCIKTAAAVAERLGMENHPLQ